MGERAVGRRIQHSHFKFSFGRSSYSAFSLQIFVPDLRLDVTSWKTRGRASTAAAPTGSCASVERAGAIVAVLAAADADAIAREQHPSCTPSFPRTL